MNRRGSVHVENLLAVKAKVQAMSKSCSKKNFDAAEVSSRQARP